MRRATRSSRMTLTALLASSVAVGSLATAGAAAAAPTCTDPTVGTAACGGRVVAEPTRSTTFHQFAGSAENLGTTLKAIERLAPRYLEVKTMAEVTGNPAHVSAGGLPLWVVRVTDENVSPAVAAAKKRVAISLSVHGLEAAGREGGLRYLEDLARWSTTTPNRPLYSGDRSFPISQVMAATETWVGFTNSDGWAAGDATSTTGPGFERANANGKDLNRDFPTVGWLDRTGGRGFALSEPEIQAWTTIVDALPNLITSSDIHGELTTPNEAVSDLIIPAGQWTPKRQEQVDQFSLRMINTIERKFTEDGVFTTGVLAAGPTTGATPRKPANVAASYDIVGYDDSGFMGDWFSQRQDTVHMDVETFLSNLVPNSGYIVPVEQAHVAAVRGNMESTIVESLVTEGVVPTSNYGRVGYVDDPNHTTSADGTGAAPMADGQVPYDVTRLRYFQALQEASGRPFTALTAEAIASGTPLAGFDSLVVTDMELPANSTADKSAYVAALKAFGAAGGQLLLTDQALGLLPELEVGITDAQLTVNRTDAGHVDFLAPLGDHPFERGLVGKPSQTYYEVMLGYPSRVRAPNYGVVRTAWEAAGGTTVATVGAQGASTSPNTILGTKPLGQGRITVFGAILPQAVETVPGVTETPHPYGLADYAVTITGGQVLDNALAYRAANVGGGPDPVVPEAPVVPLLLLGGLAVGAVVVRRRRAA